MNQKDHERTPKNFRLSRFTVNLLEMLSRELKTNMTAIVELAIARLGKERELNSSITDN